MLTGLELQEVIQTCLCAINHPCLMHRVMGKTKGLGDSLAAGHQKAWQTLSVLVASSNCRTTLQPLSCMVAPVHCTGSCCSKGWMRRMGLCWVNAGDKGLSCRRMWDRHQEKTMLWPSTMCDRSSRVKWWWAPTFPLNCIILGGLWGQSLQTADFAGSRNSP